MKAYPQDDYPARWWCASHGVEVMRENATEHLTCSIAPYTPPTEDGRATQGGTE